MRTGKLPEPVLKRSVLKQIRGKKNPMEKNTGVGCDAGICLDENTAAARVAAADLVIQGTSETDIYFGVHSGANNLWAAGFVPAWATVTLLLPEEFGETELRTCMTGINRVCCESNMEIVGGHTETIAGLPTPCINLHVMGYPYGKGIPMQSLHRKVKPGDSIIMKKYIAIDGVAKWLELRGEELKTRFCKSFLEEAMEKLPSASVEKEARIAMEYGVQAMHDIGQGGIFSALWELGERELCGMDIDLKAIPVRQETIELSEFFGKNPYYMKSTGALLIVAENGEKLHQKLIASGVPSAIIGHIIEGNERIIRNGDDTRYLDRPKQDESE